LVVIILVIILVAAIGLRNQANNEKFCEDAGFDGFLADPTGEYCFSHTEAGLKVLTPVHLIKEKGH
jgi:hypothetical protein